MRILLVHADKSPWATQRRAEALKSEWVNDEVDIAYFKDLPDGEPYDVIHFLFSGGIGKCKEYILKHKDKVFTTLASQRTLDGYFDNKDTLRDIFTSTVACVCQNPRLLNAYHTLTDADNAVYIPNGVDTNLFQPSKELVVGFVGRKSDESDHKGFNIVEKACSDLDLLLLHLQEDTYPIADMPSNFYELIDCLVVMSQSEGCNNPTLEALSMNIPVISTDVGIASELDGVTLVERDVESLTEALRKACPRLQILEEFTWDKIAKQYRDLYEKHLCLKE